MPENLSIKRPSRLEAILSEVKLKNFDEASMILRLSLMSGEISFADLQEIRQKLDSTFEANGCKTAKDSLRAELVKAYENFKEPTLTQ